MKIVQLFLSRDCSEAGYDKYLTERNIWKREEGWEESGIQVRVRLSVLTLVTSRSVGAAETSMK